jgi:predicted nucleic acid-binding protein
MLIVADTSPLNYLVLIGRVELLRELYGRVTIPEAVLTELQGEKAPDAVKQWIASRPEWLEVRTLSGPLDADAYLLTSEF